MSDCKEKQRDVRWILIYAVTLGEVDLFVRVPAKSSQLGWWTVPMKSSPLQFNVLGTLQMTD